MPAVLATAIGVLLLPGELAVKAYLAIASLFPVFATRTLSESLRQTRPRAGDRSERPGRCRGRTPGGQYTAVCPGDSVLQQPNLAAAGLLLRSFTPGDAPAIQRLAGDARIADTTASIPHPYPEGAAQRWLDQLQRETRAGETLAYAVTLAEDGELVGSMSLMHINEGEAELGYWVGVPYWGRGIATASARCLVEHGFEVLGLRRIHARVLTRNSASARVLSRLGFKTIGSEPTVCGYRQAEEPCDYFELCSVR